MSFPRILLIGAVALFSIVAVVGIAKKMMRSKTQTEAAAAPAVVKKVEKPVAAVAKPVVQKEVKKEAKLQELPIPAKVQPVAATAPQKEIPVKAPEVKKAEASSQDLPNIDRVHLLFTTGPMKLPIVETVSYSSLVPWIKGRPAWVADYASYYQTSRHFIARSLNGKPDYFNQKISTGSKFNVFRKDKNIQFYLVIDATRFKMGFYYFDLDTQERILLKTYKVGLGRLDTHKASGSLTPLGKYSLGSKIAIYKPGTTSLFQDKNIEMIRVFGTRWIPFDQELEGCTASAKGLGLHGAPWVDDGSGNLIENRDGLGKYDSDGCIRLAVEDIEEIFSIVITKPTFVMIVKDFREAQLPGIEVAAPTR